MPESPAYLALMGPPMSFAHCSVDAAVSWNTAQTSSLALFELMLRIEIRVKLISILINAAL
jgi:hypothetical protein